jgi:hypothetical protein
MGPKASASNDDNLNIITGNPDLAIQYAVNILSVYDHYHWRYSQAMAQDPSKTYQGLSTDPGWMKSYLAGDHTDQLTFMLGKPPVQKDRIDPKYGHME